MRIALCLLTAALCCSAQQQPPRKPIPGNEKLGPAVQADPLLRAALEELFRARNLRTLGEAIYYGEISFDDADSFSVSATLGSAFASRQTRLRPLRVNLRVGGPNFDNTNSIFSDYYSGTRLDSGNLPIDNDLLALRNSFWLALDHAYKTASEALGRKAAAVRGVTATEPQPDFWDAPGRILIEEPSRSKIDEAEWTKRTKALSAVFKDFPEITASGVDFEASQGTFYLVNTAGTVVRTPDRIGMLRTRASLQAPDGMVLYDGSTVVSLDPGQMPPEAELRKSVESVARNLTALAKAPVGEAYVGPVLFSGTAAPQVFAEVIATNLASTRRPVSEPGRAVPVPVSEFEGRLGARILPEWIDAFDDPSLREYAKTPLLGFYQSDLEGIFPSRLNLVENGVLKTLFTSRQPVRGLSAPNGRARLPGPFGVKVARHSNLFFRARQTESEQKLKERLIEMVKSQGKPYGMIVRKMDFPSVGSIEELRRVSQRSNRTGGGGRPISSPILIYRVYPDGREQLVRGLRLRSLTTRSFRDILAAGDHEHLVSYLDNGAPMALTGAGSYIVGCSVVAPSVLFEDLEFESGGEELLKPPVVPPPSLNSER